jgi:signal transduction histidine kinase/ligand-binding sensor domain-containing protein
MRSRSSVALFFEIECGIGDDTQGVAISITKVLLVSRTVLLLPIVLTSMVALAHDQVLRTSQISHTSWRLQDGVFNGVPTAIVQTADGYLWIGTSSGLMRFDGVRFVPWNPPPEGSAVSKGVYALGASRDGSLWIGASDMMRWKDGKLFSYPNLDARTNAILEDPAGGVWATRSRIQDGLGPLCHFSDEGVRCFGTRDGISISYAGALFRDVSGTLWLGGSGGLARGKPGSFETFVPPSLKALEQLGGVGAFADGPDGSMLIGMVQSGPNMGLQQLKADHWTSFTSAGFDGSTLQISNMLTDRSGYLWIGTVSQGLCVVRDRRSDYFRSSDGLSGNVITAIYEDRENNIWVVTTGGLDRFRIPKVLTFSSREGLSSDYAGSVLAGSDGNVWVGNHDALDNIYEGSVSSIREDQGLPGRRVTVLLEDHLGRLWVGADNTLSVREGRKFHRLSRSDGSPVGTLQMLIEDRNGDLWGMMAPSLSRLIHIHGFTVQEEAVGPAASHIRSIVADPAGGITVGFRSGDIASYRDGLLRMVIPKVGGLSYQLDYTPDNHLLILSSGHLMGWQNGKLQTLQLQNGLPCDTAFTFLVDKQRTLWLYSSCGLIALDNEELQRWWNDSNVKLQYSLFDSFDGVQAAYTPFTPRASEAPDGKLWFVNGTVAQMIDPKNLPRNRLAPAVHIENLVADRKSYPLQQALRLPPLTRDLEIDYTGLSFVVPQKVQFRYRLEDRDTDWQDPGNRRAAFYTDLPPGRYRFHVIASNNDGVWNSSGASLEFAIEPALYQTWWLRTASIVAALAIIGWAIRVRMLVIAKNIRARLVERVDERERIARELHDTLLQGILSASLQLDVADRQIAPDATAKPVVQRVSQLLRHLSDESRQTVRGLRLRQSEEENLERALTQISKDLAVPRKVKYQVVVEGTPRSLRPLVRDEIYRIGAEALANAFSHARASTVETVLEYGRDHFRLLVRDDGKGIDPEVLKVGREGHFGLSGLRERASKIGARLKIRTATGAGTEIDLLVPAVAAFEHPAPRGLMNWIAKLYSRGSTP